MSLSESSAWLEQALRSLNSDGDSALQLDSETLHSLVIYCERAPPPDAKEYLLNIVGDDRSKDIVAEYLQRRGATNLVPDPGMQAYHKPKDEETWVTGTKKSIKSKAGPNEGSASSSVHKESDYKPPLFSGHGVLSAENIIHKGKRPVGKGKKKGVSLGEAAKGSLVFARGGPCTCQCSRHALINNCLSCGRIVCDQEGEGPCYFCGALVLREGSDYGGLDGVAAPLSTEAEIKAEEFKNRLVEYDRSAAARTSVIDDQSDYFELDGNKWLTEKEKELLQKQLDEAERAAEERRKRVVVTIDLLGRKVISAEQPDGKKATQGISILGMDVPISQEQPLVSRVKPNPSLKQSPIFVETKESTSDGPAKTSKTSRSSSRHSTGVAKSKRIQHDDPIVEAVIGHNLDLDIGTEEQERHVWNSPNPQSSDQTEKELFYNCQAEPSDMNERKGRAANASTSGTGQHSAIGNGDARKAGERGPAFDICLAQRTGNSKVGTMSASRLAKKQTERRNAQGESHENANSVLMPGMILLKRWLSPDQQVEIVNFCRTAGLGSGGFYIPQYGSDSKMHLQMMCLGMQWEPTLKAYGPRRTNFDNALAPPIPDSFVQLVETVLRAAGAANNQATDGKGKVARVNQSSIPHMTPNVCIVNFYERSGNLGMHQDKDESAESLKQGRPVVSFSIGDSAEFAYGKERDVSKAEKVTLESGDVLVFGGPSRMIFHGVTHVAPDSSPEWLSQRTGLRPGRLNLTFRQY